LKVSQFRKLIGADGNKIVEYRREVQPMNRRNITRLVGCKVSTELEAMAAKIKYKIIE
jgi:hypothetical protein